MVIDELRLRNFGVFRGEHVVGLAPPCDRRPIVLFGGLNGAGKTTLLEALQLALYGRHALFLGTGRGYDRYLRRAIHRDCDPAEGAGVELVLRINEDGREITYDIRRKWHVDNDRIAEEVEVRVNGTTDAVLSENWIEHAERLIPARLSRLFFFDGERIESLADPRQSSDVLSTAINALLGVDLVAQLQVDLQVLAQRKQRVLKTATEQEQIDQLSEQLEALTVRARDLAQKCAALRNERDRAARRLRSAESEFDAQGGRLSAERRDLERRRGEVHAKLEVLRSQLIQLASGVLPLSLVTPLLQEVAAQSDHEQRTEKAQVLSEVAAARDQRLITHLEGLGLDPTTLRAVKRFLRDDLREYSVPSSGVDSYLRLAGEDVHRIKSLLNTQLSQSRREAEQQIEAFALLEAELDELDRKLAAVPDEDAISGLLAKVNSARKDLAEAEHLLHTAEQRLADAQREKMQLEKQRERILRTSRESELENQDIHRHLLHSRRVRHALERFRVKLIAKHATHLKEAILEGYKQLLRKKSLVERIEIDPESCRLHLYNGDGRALPQDRLSAGERQLLAVAMLWGLARASGRPLPTVIDTPLGRLDATHRMHLVERYFPYASHQVLLLSTDKEIDEGYHRCLRNRVGRAYRLVYDDKSNSSTIEAGYFW